MTTNPNDIEALELELARLSQIMVEGAGGPLTPERRKVILTHRLITDLVRADGGTPELRAWAVKRLTDIIEGKA